MASNRLAGRKRKSNKLIKMRLIEIYFRITLNFSVWNSAVLTWHLAEFTVHDVRVRSLPVAVCHARAPQFHWFANAYQAGIISRRLSAWQCQGLIRISDRWDSPRFLDQNFSFFNSNPTRSSLPRCSQRFELMGAIPEINVFNSLTNIRIIIYPIELRNSWSCSQCS